MILPLPVPPASREDAVRFIDFRAYPGFFADLHRPFSGNPTHTGGGAANAKLPEPRLKVHRVGSFHASFVPSIADFARLDERFRLPDAVWGPRYADWGFAVFELVDVTDTSVIEPMALDWPRRDPTALFFPTLHIHDGTAHASAEYDHNLFFQTHEHEAIARVGNHARRAASSGKAAPEFSSPLRARGVLDQELPVQVARFEGVLPNSDAWMGRAPSDRELDVFRAWRGGSWPVERAVSLISRLASARAPNAADDPAAALAVVGWLPWTMQSSSWGEGLTCAAPEFLRMEALDERTDVYAFGALLYHLVAGEPPFGSHWNAVVGHMDKPTPRLGLPIDDITSRAMHKDPAQRFPTLRAFVDRLGDRSRT